LKQLKNHQGGIVKVVNIGRRLNIVNKYYIKTGFYPFIKKTIIKGTIIILIIITILFLLDYFFIDTNALLDNLVHHYDTWIVMAIFYLSESFLGILLPDIFIAWCAKMDYPWLTLFGVATLSYLGGCTAYYIGKMIRKIPKINTYIENKVAKHVKKLHKWGGFFVMAGALLPIPFSIISMASGLIKYKFKYYSLWSLFRYPRFFIYAIIIFKIF